MNGRQWLARQMDRVGIDYRQRDNCFLWIEDYAAAQKLLDEQLASKASQATAELYPKFLRHAISSFQSPDVLRFLGRKVPQSSGKAHAGFEGEVNSRLQERTEGVRIRHTLNGNSLKMHDKEGSILRVETTIVRPKDFRVYRAKERRAQGAEKLAYFTQRRQRYVPAGGSLSRCQPALP